MEQLPVPNWGWDRHHFIMVKPAKAASVFGKRS